MFYLVIDLEMCKVPRYYEKELINMQMKLYRLELFF